MPARISLFEYRIVETVVGSDALFMPQRGVPENHDAIVVKFLWRDALPVAAPTLELAQAYLKALQVADARETEGRVVPGSETFV